MRWVYVQSSNQYKNHFTVTIIQHSTNATRLGVPADIVHFPQPMWGTNNILIHGHADIGE